MRAKFAAAWGVELPERAGYRLDQMMSGLHDGRVKALYLIGENPAQTEPNAHHVEEGLVAARVPRRAGPVPERDLDAPRRRRPPGLELRGEGRHLHEHRAAREPRPRRRAAARERARRPARSCIALARALGCDWPEYPDAESVWNELADLSPELVRDPLRPARAGRASSGRAPTRDHPGTMFLHEEHPSLPSGQGQVPPGRVPAADRGARLRVPVRALDRPDALPLQLGDDDHARGRDHRQAGRPVRRDLAPRTRRRSASPTATGCGSSPGAASSRRGRSSPTASTRASSGWRSTSPRRR